LDQIESRKLAFLEVRKKVSTQHYYSFRYNEGEGQNLQIAYSNIAKVNIVGSAVVLEPYVSFERAIAHAGQFLVLGG
jgi:hypothetical protein